MKVTSFLPLLLAGVQGVFGQNTAGCGQNPPSSGVKSINVGGMNREYILQLPNNYDPNKGHMLIFGLHWLSGSMHDVHPNYYGLRQLAGNNAIFISPNGINNGWANDGGRDVNFIDAILQQVRSQLCINDSQIFATGFSFGGGMSYALGCARANVFRAIAPIAGAQISGCSGGTSPIAFLGIHGTNDDVLPIAMGRQVRDRFLQNNGCQPKNAPEPGWGQGPIKTEYSCQPNYPVTWIAFSGGHDPNQSFVGREIWDFFSQFGGTNPGPSPPPTSPPPTNPPPTNPPPTNPPPTNPPPSGGCSAMWGQCGGMGWNGPQCCSQGTCQQQNPWYSQCL